MPPVPVVVWNALTSKDCPSGPVTLIVIGPVNPAFGLNVAFSTAPGNASTSNVTSCAVATASNLSFNVMPSTPTNEAAVIKPLSPSVPTKRSPGTNVGASTFSVTGIDTLFVGSSALLNTSVVVCGPGERPIGSNA